MGSHVVAYELHKFEDFSFILLITFLSIVVYI